MNELSFLVNYLIDHKLSKAAKDDLIARIKVVEESYRPQPDTSRQLTGQSQPPVRMFPTVGQQAPSILAKYPDLAIPPIIDDGPMCLRDDMKPPPVPVTQIAQTPETAKALAERQALITQSMSGKPEPGRTGPRKIGRQ